MSKYNSNKLCIEDIKELQHKQMLSNPIIEFVLEMKKVISNNKFLYVNCFLTRHIMHDTVNLKWLSDIDLISSDIVIFPCHSGSHTNGHWTLVIINTRIKEFYFFDSGKQVTEQEAAGVEAFNQFKIFLGKYKKLGLPEQYKNVYKKYQRQTDSYNCGVFVLFFVDQFLNQSKTKLNPKEYRAQLKIECCENSDKMHDYCRKCHKKTEGDTVQCKSCLSWYHARCLGMDLKTLQQKGIQFNCSICC